ncbi:hypothetical protein BC831DRAFT_554231 [Entophlyctis helioformis]|nr:hypothetical protein BC831DRAFT_554231 [Entophlyctis helioformis]
MDARLHGACDDGQRVRLLLLLAPGSLGDALPLAAIALHLHAALPSLGFRLVANAAACNALRVLLPSALAHRLHLWPIPAVPPSSPHAAQRQHELACMLAAATLSPSPSSPSQSPSQSPPSQSPPDSTGRIIGVVFTLFAIEGWSMAEALHVPAIAVSPFSPSTVPAPRSFLAALAHARPDLVSRLDAAAMADLATWQWRLHLDDQGDLRAGLGLPPAPIDDDAAASLPDTRLLVLQDGRLLQRVDCPSPRIVWTGHCALPNSNTLLVVPHAAWLDDVTDVAVVTFGSMDTLSRVLIDEPSAHQLLMHVCCALAAHGMRGLWITADTTTLHAVHERLCTTLPLVRTTLRLCGTVPLPALLQTLQSSHGREGSVIVVHHGGSGTFHTAAAAGVPQVILPLRFDQHGVGEAAVAVGIAHVVDTDAALDDWTAAVGWAVDVSAQEAAGRVRQQLLAQPPGTHTAAAHIIESLGLLEPHTR